jgi:hypothetical protein
MTAQNVTARTLIQTGGTLTARRLNVKRKKGMMTMKPIHKNCYMILSTDTNDKPNEPSEAQPVKQVFDTLQDAEAWIISDALDTANLEACEFIKGRDETWGSDHIIVKVVKIVRPIPTATITMEVKEVK